MSMRPSEAGGESLVQYLNDAGETSLAQSLEEWGLTAHHLISKQERSMFLREVGATLAQRAVVMGYLKRIVPATNQYGYPSYEARELRESAEDLKFFAHLETVCGHLFLTFTSPSSHPTALCRSTAGSETFPLLQNLRDNRRHPCVEGPPSADPR